jgi:hypothetical protein
MGYTTQFKGKLSFTQELSASQLAAVNEMCGEDCREHPEWEAQGLYYIDLKLTDDFLGLEWDGSEKTYDMDKLVNVVITQMRKRWPDFGLTGTLSAQGEDNGDVWALVIGSDGMATRQKLVVTGEKITCPHCEKSFVLPAAQESKEGREA